MRKIKKRGGGKEKDLKKMRERERENKIKKRIQDTHKEPTTEESMTRLKITLFLT